MSRNIIKLQAGDILLLPVYYYSQPYKTLSDVIDFSADFLIDTIENSLEKLIGKQATSMLKQIIPQDIDSDEITTSIVRKAMEITDVKYIHQEIYLQNGWTLSAHMNGVKLIKYKPSALQKFDIYRFNDADEKRIIDSVEKYWNLPFDYSSQAISRVQELLSLPMRTVFGVEDLEDKIEGFLDYDNEENVSSGELCARILDEAGIKMGNSLEYISPQDLSEISHARLL